MSRLTRRSKLLIVFFALVAVGYIFAVWHPGFSKAVPNDFTDARTKGALIAAQIVDLTNQSASDIQKINDLDKEHNLTEALALTTDVTKRSQNIRDLAVDLSNELGKMAQSLPSIKSPEARQVALESLSSRLALMSRLVNYSNYLGELLTTLQDRFTGDGMKDKQVAQIIDNINSEVSAINNFNRQASDAMTRFDGIINK